MNENFDIKAFEWLNNNQLSYDIWDKKYRNENESFDDWLKRVSGNNFEIANLIFQKKFLFGGRILANRGIINRGISYSNCYVLPPVTDSIEGIYDTCAKMARTFSFGGGVGTDLSQLRPNGALVHNSAKATTGAASFMDTLSMVSETIGQSGRRAALMLSIDINHPDVEEFITKKQDLQKVLGANISVRVNDKFMQAVQNNEDYLLRFPCNEHIVLHQDELEYNKLYFKHNVYIKLVKARELWNKLIHCAYDTGEPGVLFWDTIENYNILTNDLDFHYAGTNPCGEEPLPEYGACNLGSINLSEFVKDNTFDEHSFIKTVHICVRALNTVLEEGAKLHPLEQQRQMVDDYMQIGLGVFGIADMLIKLGLKYSGQEARNICNHISDIMAREAILESLSIAKVKGCYNKFTSNIINSPYLIAHTTEETRKEIAKYGLRNSQLLTIAPTGTLSTMFNVSGGIEPIFALEYNRTTKSLHDGDYTYKVYPTIVENYIKEHNLESIKDLPDYFEYAAIIPSIDRINMQSIWQSHIDASISSTINLPKQITEQEVNDIYFKAWDSKLKGITIFREGCRRVAILNTNTQPIITNRQAPKRPNELEADYYQVKVKGEQFIVLVGLLDNKPYEIFTFRPKFPVNIEQHKGKIIKEKKMHYKFESPYIIISDLQLANDNIEEKAATLYSSMLLRHGADIKYIVKTAKKVNENITSFSSAMCRILSKYIPDGETNEKCPDCGERKLVYENGCKHCTNCGWSACS